jgi:hypothetical protein
MADGIMIAGAHASWRPHLTKSQRYIKESALLVQLILSNDSLEIPQKLP